MEAGRTPDMLAVDEPVTINGWSPRNFEDGFLGQITLREALAHSINTVAARLADEVGRDVGRRDRPPRGHRLADQYRTGHGARHDAGHPPGDGPGL